MAAKPHPKSPHAGGEEWRDMDRTDRPYDPDAQKDVLQEARRRIRDLRMRDVHLRLVDAAGKPLPGVPLQIEQLRHAFPFGNNLWTLDAFARDGEWDTGRARAWRERFAEVFSAANNLCYWTERPRNDASKVEDRQGDWRIENFARTVEWTLGEGMIAKGHPLFWSIPKCVPEWLKRYDYPTQMKFAEVRVRNIVARFRGKVTLWDAVNEPMWEAAFKNLPNRQWPHIEAIEDIADYIDPVLRWCRDEDPDATFLVNDYGMTQDKQAEPLVGHDGSSVTAASQRKRFLALIDALGRRGSAPDAIGLQSHTGWVDHAHQWHVYDEFTASGLPVHITEFWAGTRELEAAGKYSPDQIDHLQADYVANFLTAAFGHPAIQGFFFWGFMNSAIDWRRDRSGHEPKPAFHRVRDLIRGEWWTREKVTTGPDGVARFRAFFGHHAARYPLPRGSQTGLRFTVDRADEGPLALRAVVRPAP